MAQVYKRALRGERDWLIHDLGDVVTVRRYLLTEGISPSKVDGILAWLIAKSLGEQDTTSEPTRARYRRVLAGLDSPLTSPSSDAIPRYVNSPAGTPRAA